jgi:hypothetical protein
MTSYDEDVSFAFPLSDDSLERMEVCRSEVKEESNISGSFVRGHVFVCVEEEATSKVERETLAGKFIPCASAALIFHFDSLVFKFLKKK